MYTRNVMRHYDGFYTNKPYPRVVGIDIGGFTTDYLTMVRGTIDIEHTDSLEQGLTLLYQTIHKSA